jgi:ABC-type multidrug transport system ATPase subunit
MTVVKALAASGVTVCATIHSPTPYSFNLFDRLLLMLRGRVVYFGRNGAQVTDYLRASPLSLDTTVDAGSSSVAEWITGALAGRGEGRGGWG